MEDRCIGDASVFIDEGSEPLVGKALCVMEGPLSTVVPGDSSLDLQGAVLDGDGTLAGDAILDQKAQDPTIRKKNSP